MYSPRSTFISHNVCGNLSILLFDVPEQYPTLYVELARTKRILYELF